MKLARDLPLQKKMLVITLLICGATLCVAIAALFAFQVLNFRLDFQHDATTVAAIIANNSESAMSFKDEDAATSVVRSLQAKPTVLGAALVLPDGKILGVFGAAESSSSLSQYPPAGQSKFIGGHLLVTQPVIWKQERVGTLYLRSDYWRTLRALLSFYALLILAIMLVSIGLASFLSGRLGRRITEPVLALARTAKIVGEQKNYAVRAAVTSQGDELGLLAESFNEMLGRIESQDAALSFSQRKLELLINSIDGIVWESDPNRTRFSYVSRQSESILGYAPQAWLDTPGFWETRLEPHDAIRAVQQAADALADRQPYTFEYRITAADGRTVWIRESGTVLVEQEQAVALRGIFQDVTRQKLDAEQLDKLNRQLQSTSRMAGMAEVATGVLHNVGNVLNSVSVSATLVADRLRRSKLSNLRRAAEMLCENTGNLAEFLSTDKKGKVLPEYLTTITEQLAGEQSLLIAQMDSVGQHIEHIKEIVAMQQSYAKVSGVFENLSPADLLEDALRMNLAAFDRHHIEVVREPADHLPTVCVDRHKVLQILINLLRNAKYAMDQREDTAKRLVVGASSASLDRVKITIKDNGVGIAPEHLTRIFSHGFTTKKDGHGFGLHSGANAAKEMGGSLTAYSAGLGQGAEFTLELPISARAPHGGDERSVPGAAATPAIESPDKCSRSPVIS